MVAIIGTTPDDILYFKTKMIIEKEEVVAKNVTCYVGSFAKTQCVVVATGHSNMVSSAVTTLVINKYDPYLIYNVGQVTSITQNGRQCDLFVAERIYIGNINMDGFGRVTYNNIPNLPEFFFTQDSYITALQAIIPGITTKYLIRGSIYSSDIFYTDQSLIMPTLNKYFKEGNNIYAIDCESAGVFLAGYLKKVPVISIKVISNELANKDQLVNFVRKGLEVMPVVGKIVTASLASRSSFSSSDNQ
jgi:nucleoside phosphorylase